MPRINTKKDDTQVHETWIPTASEQKAFNEFIAPFTVWIEGRESELMGRVVKIKSHRGYKDTRFGKLYAMEKFGAVTLKDYFGEPMPAIKMAVYTNDFIKTGFETNLYHKFQKLENTYFRTLTAEQKQMEFYQQNENI